MSALLAALLLAPLRALPATGEAIDRHALVTRHNLEWNELRGQTPLGNGEFCFNADSTGLQSFGGSTLAHWAWHAAPLPPGCTPAVDVVNTGRRSGTEVPQLYLAAGEPEPRLPMSAQFTLDPAPERPDFQILQVRTVPAFPSPGDRVHFVASVVNRGTGPATAASTPRVEFRVNGQLMASGGGTHDPIPAGGMMLIGSENSAFTCPTGADRQVITATVDARDEIKEIDESNNTLQRILAQGGARTGDR